MINLLLSSKHNKCILCTDKHITNCLDRTIFQIIALIKVVLKGCLPFKTYSLNNYLQVVGLQLFSFLHCKSDDQNAIQQIRRCQV